MGKKKNLKEGRIRRFVDWIFYSLLNGINQSIIDSLKNDPEMDKAIKDFEEAQEKLETRLKDFGENPKDYIDDLEEE